MRIAYVTTYDANDRFHWSGLGYAILQALRAQGLEVTPIGPLHQPFRWLGKAMTRFYNYCYGQTCDFEREAIVGWDYARQVASKLGKGKYDIVFSPGSIPISRLQCRQPVVIWADATFDSLISHYPFYDKLCVRSVDSGNRTEHLALNRCSLAFFASDWAARSALELYATNPTKVKVVPFGANLNNLPGRHDVLETVERRERDSFRLITLGVDWMRKGIPRAIELASILNQRGIPTKLTVVGCKPPQGISVPEYVKLTGFIDKRSPDGEKQIIKLLSESHFHVLFSRAECFGVVFAEANALGVPNITTNVGGIGSAVIDGRGGQKFNQDSPTNEIADYLQDYLQQWSRYIDLAKAARNEYEDRLNWKVAGSIVKNHLEDLLYQTKTIGSIGKKRSMKVCELQSKDHNEV